MSELTPKMITVQQHIIEHQRLHHPTATGEFSWLLSGITLATKIISDHVRRAGLRDVLGSAGKTNVQGETVQKLDIIANETIMACLGYRGNVGIMVSEEDDEPTIIKELDGQAKYIVLFDPLDGSSNIDVNVSIGTIFSVLQRREGVQAGRIGEQQHEQRFGALLFGGRDLGVYRVRRGHCTIERDVRCRGQGRQDLASDPGLARLAQFRRQRVVEFEGEADKMHLGLRRCHALGPPARSPG